MNRHQFKEQREHRFAITQPSTEDPVLVVCPQCFNKAYVVPHGEDRVKCSCHRCGYTKEKPTKGRSYEWHLENPTDEYFGFDHWLRTNCVGHSLWAFNLRHLAFL
jgi:ribosomal protein S27E